MSFVTLNNTVQTCNIISMHGQTDEFVTSNNTVQIDQPCNIIFSMHGREVVVVNEDGSVTYNGPPDEASETFWQAVSVMNPYVSKIAKIERENKRLKEKIEQYNQILSENQKEFLKRLDPDSE